MLEDLLACWTDLFRLANLSMASTWACGTTLSILIANHYLGDSTTAEKEQTRRLFEFQKIVKTQVKPLQMPPIANAAVLASVCRLSRQCCHVKWSSACNKPTFSWRSGVRSLGSICRHKPTPTCDDQAAVCRARQSSFSVST